MSPSAALAHTYGPTCAFHRPTHDASSLEPPPVRSHFFYTSAVPIDDPLSPLPPLVSAANTAAKSKFPSRPFSAHDNAALEEAWLGFLAENEPQRENSRRSKQSKAIRISGSKAAADGTAANNDLGEEDPTEVEVYPVQGVEEVGEREGGRKKRPKSTRNKSSKPAKENSLKDGEHGISEAEDVPESDKDTSSGSLARRISSRFRNKDGNRVSDLKVKKVSPAFRTRQAGATMYGTSPSESDTTGTPFIRAPARSERPRSGLDIDTLAVHKEAEDQANEGDRSAEQTASDPTSSSASLPHASERGTKTKSPSKLRSRLQKTETGGTCVPVGISRLHLVRFPEMRMEPIYWSPANDVSAVTRGTWFYRDTFLPMEPGVANQLEAGYKELKPWTETWNDELNSAIEVGAEGELKITHRLYPDEVPKRPSTSEQTTEMTQELGDERPLERLEANQAAGGSKSDIAVPPIDATTNYMNASVIYIDAKEAYILPKPSLLPSRSSSRRPLAAIRKGKTVGVPVVRGFDWEAWEKAHPPRRSAAALKAEEGGKVSQSGTAYVDSGNKCEPCLKQEERPNVTDLVLVIHGIGQKLSERVESFGFTHAINSFRRMMNVEMRTESVRQHFRPDLEGIMILPINWRSTLSFEDGGPPSVDENGELDPAVNHFSLNDIMPETIPAVRNLISDVMLDIPYYLSHHKPRMIKAVIKEANRIYRLWCKNNPLFDKTGHVHLIAHSLGSAMAVDILSNQPTTLPRELNLDKKILEDQFEFDTKNLFFCGSPAGFFLLLNRKSLLPRRGRNKIDMDGEDLGNGVAGDTGMYGCMAVDNIYNVMHLFDPIANCLNATVDTEYASSIKTASVPNASPTMFESISNAFRSITPSAAVIPDAPLLKPSVNRLPSTVEMETHNFTREEIAEKRMYLLNDNGQVDWFLTTGNGPLEIHYLNMLGAHSSYWYSRDFCRFLCLEVGRKPGRENTLLNMRPAKKVHRK